MKDSSVNLDMNNKEQQLNQKIKEQLKNWSSIVKRYQTPNLGRAIWQICNTIVPFLSLWVLMYFSLKLKWSYFITMGLGLINGFLLVRVFIIQHDCGHRSFFKNQKANQVVGYILSFFSSIPFKYWAKTHAFHHGHNGQLEHTNVGDIKTLTVAEYDKLSNGQKFRYRLFRNPVVLFGFGPIYYLLLSCRWPLIQFKGWGNLLYGLTINNVLIGLFYVGLAILIGPVKFLLIQIPILLVFGITAVWFFYVQHQHEETYKQWQEKWDYLLSAIKGSTYYKLPGVVNWFSGNIGFHHIHHLNPSIPNYNLKKCAAENPILQKYTTIISFGESLKCVNHHLWDENDQKMISFWEYRKRKKAA